MIVFLGLSFRTIPKSNLLKNFFDKSTGGKVCARYHDEFWRKLPRKWLRIQKFCTGKSLKNIVKSPLGEVAESSSLFHEKIFSDWSLWENKIAIRCGLTGKKYKYREVRKKSNALAAAFQKKFKLEKGDRLAVILPNCPEFPILILAASQAGVVPTTVNPLYTPYEIQWQLEDCQSKLVITSSSGYEKCFEVVQSMKKSIPIIVVKIFKEDIIPEGAVDLDELLDPSNFDSLKPVNTEISDVAIIPYSSGTTGNPKGVLLTHKSIVSNLIQISHPETCLVKPTTTFHQDKILGVLPMFHIYGLMITVFFSLKDGCQVITMPKFDPLLYLRNIFLNRACILYVVPPIIKLLIDEKVKKVNLRSVEFLINAASPLNINDAYTLLEKAPQIKIAQGYGMTEASPVIAHTHPKRMQKLSSIGIPVASSQVKVVNVDTGALLGKGEHGELRVSGPQLMKGYLNRPEETENAFDGDGYLRTGDVVYYDDDGDFFVVDRLKELIKVKGFQVAPAELEEILRAHPKIKDAAVVGISDPVHGEVPKAFVILEKGAQMSEDEVKDFIKRKLSHYKQLRGGVVFVDDFPRNKIGKVLKRALKDM